jgi:hypothetical protein
MIAKYKFGLWAVFMVFFFNSCKKDCPCTDSTNPDCPNYDPCFKWRTVDTKFLVFQGNSGFAVPTWCDNIPSCDTLNNPQLILKAPLNNVNECEYEWQIGTDTTIRKGKIVSVNFGDYLDQVGWEKHFVVNLTIKRPLDRCLENPNDTVVKTSRSVFFTKEVIFYSQLPFTINTQILKGYFTHDPKKEVILKFFKMKTFRGIGTGSSLDSLTLITGYPFADTIISIGQCGSNLGCGNYRFRRFKLGQPKCPQTGNLSYQETYIYYDNRIRLYREFVNNDNSITSYEFIGEKI